MEQRHLPDQNEPVSDDEVRALIERFGERQATPSGQPTIKDVAETLQVDPTTVAKMLTEIRGSKDQEEIKQRLDRLEKENTELRARTTHLPDQSSPVFQKRQRIAISVAVLSAVFVAFISAMKFGSRPLSVIMIMLTVIVFVVIGVLFAAKRMRQ